MFILPTNRQDGQLRKPLGSTFIARYLVVNMKLWHYVRDTPPSIGTMGMTFQTIIIFRRDLADLIFSGILANKNPKGLDPLYLNSGVLRKGP
jgi:hypothetical protein